MEELINQLLAGENEAIKKVSLHVYLTIFTISPCGDATFHGRTKISTFPPAGRESNVYLAAAD
jgi:hypothetical protein